MSGDFGERRISSTPILDAILTILPPPMLRLEITITKNMPVYKKSFDRLQKKVDDGTITRMDIENELSSMPQQGGIEEVKRQLVDDIRSSLIIKKKDINTLP